MLDHLRLVLNVVMALLNSGRQPSAMGKFSHQFLVAETVSALFATHIPSAQAQGPSMNATTNLIGIM